MRRRAQGYTGDLARRLRMRRLRRRDSVDAKNDGEGMESFTQYLDALVRITHSASTAAALISLRLCFTLPLSSSSTALKA